MSQNIIKADDGCFVCGCENPVGLHAEFVVDSENNRARASLSIDSNFQGWQGVVHGGIIATLLDETAIYACRTLSHTAVTAGMTIKFKKPVRIDCPLTLQADVISVKRRIALVTSSLLVDSEVMAEAEVKVMLLNEESA